MKIELTKETRANTDSNASEDILYWVIIDDSYASKSKPFPLQEDAKSYYDSLKAFCLKHGQINDVKETIISEEF